MQTFFNNVLYMVIGYILLHNHMNATYTIPSLLNLGARSSHLVSMAVILRKCNELCNLVTLLTIAPLSRTNILAASQVFYWLQISGLFSPRIFQIEDWGRLMVMKTKLYSNK